MQFNMFEAGASKVPPKKPLNPSIGYPSNGDLSNGEAPTQLGAYWIYQFSEEFTALLKDNGIEPSPDDLHQLSTFFKNYKTALDEIKEVAVEAGSGAKGVLADMRQTHKEMIALKAGTADDLEKTRSDLEDTRNALSEVNSVLDDARTYTQKFNVFQNDLDTHKADVQALINKSADLKNQVGSIVSGVQADKKETKSYRDQAQQAAEQAKVVAWKDIKSKPAEFPPAAHEHNLTQMTGALPWSRVSNKPSEFPAASHKHTASDLNGVLKSDDASRFIAAQSARGAIGGYETAEAKKGVSSVTISKESKDTTVLLNLSGTVNVTFTPAGEGECCVKVVAFKTGTSKAVLKMAGARWAGGEAPSWGNPGKTLILAAHFIGGEVVLGVFDNNQE